MAQRTTLPDEAVEDSPPPSALDEELLGGSANLGQRQWSKLKAIPTYSGSTPRKYDRTPPLHHLCHRTKITRSRVLQFADDIALTNAWKSTKGAQNGLTKGLEELHEWCDKWRIKLNATRLTLCYSLAKWSQRYNLYASETRTYRPSQR